MPTSSPCWATSGTEKSAWAAYAGRARILRMAGRILDGDEETFWTPAAGAALEDWWVEVDLGRAALRHGDCGKIRPLGQSLQHVPSICLHGRGSSLFWLWTQEIQLVGPRQPVPIPMYEITYPLLPQDVKLSGRGELTFRQFVRFCAVSGPAPSRKPALGRNRGQCSWATISS